MKNIKSLLLCALLLSTSLLYCMENTNERRDASTKDGIYPYCPIYQEELLTIALDNKMRLLNGTTRLEGDDKYATYQCIKQIGLALSQSNKPNLDKQAKIYLKDGELVGFITYYIKHNSRPLKYIEATPAYIHHLAIDKKHRGKGYGAALLEAALHDCKDKGASRITLDTSGPYDDLHRLYTKFGFYMSDKENILNGFSRSYALRWKPHPLARTAQKILKWLKRK